MIHGHCCVGKLCLSSQSRLVSGNIKLLVAVKFCSWLRTRACKEVIGASHLGDDMRLP